MSAEFADRPEVTVSTMGKVHNPSGKNVPVKASARSRRVHSIDSKSSEKALETVTSSKNSAKRNIVRKNNAVATKDNYDNRGKKMGGAGKGQWGNKLQDRWDDYDAAGDAAFDKDDPLYDETEENYILVSDSIAIDGYESTKFQDTKLYGPVYTQTEFKRRVSDICVEFYSTSMISDTILQLKELLESCQDYGCFIVKKCIEKSLDFSNRECELTSKLLVRLVHSDKGEDVTPPLLSSDEMEQGFELILENLDELMIDCPEAPNALTCYLARSVVDEVISPSFLVRFENDLELAGDDQHDAISVIHATKRLLSREHGSIRLEHVWGPGDGTRTIAELKKMINEILREYLLCSLDISEAVRSIQELNVCPFFGHELVKQAIIMSIEDHDSKDIPAKPVEVMVMLLLALHEGASNDSTNASTLLPLNQLQLGMSRFEANYLKDLQLDVPAADTLYNEFCCTVRGIKAFTDLKM